MPRDTRVNAIEEEPGRRRTSCPEGREGTGGETGNGRGSLSDVTARIDADIPGNRAPRC